MDRIIQSITSLFKLDRENLHALTDALRPLRVAKKTLLIDPYKKDNNIYFIEQGIARAYILVDGKEVTTWFSKEGDLIYSTNSVYGTTEGYENETVQVLEDSLLYFTPIAELEQLCHEYSDVANWLRVLYQHAFIAMEKRLMYRLYMSAEERYKDFAKNNSVLFQRVNLSYIASYLGMSNVTLWSLRKQ
jgi:CRP-like cAMP-binding protein